MGPSVGNPAFHQVHPRPLGSSKPQSHYTPFRTKLNEWFPQDPCNWLPQTFPPQSTIPICPSVWEPP